MCAPGYPFLSPRLVEMQLALIAGQSGQYPKYDELIALDRELPAVGATSPPAPKDCLETFNKWLLYIIMSLKTPKGGDRRPIFILGDFVEAFVGGRSPFEKIAM